MRLKAVRRTRSGPEVVTLGRAMMRTILMAMVKRIP
jgi:hypothetical protein